MVTAGTVVAEVSDRSNMLLGAPFNSSDAANISAGQAAAVTIVSTGEVLTGKVTKGFLCGNDWLGRCACAQCHNNRFQPGVGFPRL